MDVIEKDRLIKAINSKGLRNSLISIPDEIHIIPLFVVGAAGCWGAVGAFEQPRHIASQGAHAAKFLDILQREIEALRVL